MLCKKPSASNGIAIGVVEDFGLDEFRLRLQGGFIRCIPVLIWNIRHINRRKIIDNFEIVNKELYTLK